MSVCKVCSNASDNRVHVAREMMFGFRHSFEYLECGKCGCVQLVNVPADLSPYYPGGYYSFSSESAFKRYLRNAWARHAFGRASVLGGLISRVHGDHQAVQAIKRLKPAMAARVLDVGCGSGQLLEDLLRLGFSQLSGIDPYVPKDTRSRGLTIHRLTLSELKGEFDIITMNHSFEHMDRPLEVLEECSRLLANGGTLILRIPSASSFAWRHYGVNWVGLDAPRHLFLHTDRSIHELCAKTGFEVIETIHECTMDSILGSEQYLRDVPLTDARSFIRRPLRFYLPLREASRLRRQTREINEAGESDVVCIYLRRKVFGDPLGG